MMNRKTVFVCFVALFAFANFAKAQQVSLNYIYKMEPALITVGPEMIGAPQIDYPEEAKKNGVEGTLKASFTIGTDGLTQDIKIEQSLPFGVDAAVTSGLQKLRFKPAKLQENAVAVKMYFDYVVSAVYSETDKNVSKPKITSQPDPVYPSQYAAEKLKGEVFVTVMCGSDGKVTLLGVNSVMPKEFDRAAAGAAANLKFDPAIHKKSKKPVSQQLTVKYKFKP
jgi:TonB family protein